MAVIPGVSNNELVRTTWGNAVATELNGNSVRRNGLNAAGTAAEQMTGPLILPTTQSTDPNAAVHRGYADSTFVDVTGDTMTGTLIINGPAGDECMRLRGANAHLAFYNEAGTARQGYVAGTTTELKMASEAPVLTFLTDLAERMRINGAALLIGRTSDDSNLAGTSIYGTGHSSAGSIRSTIASTGATLNLQLKHIGTADDAGEIFLACQRSSASTTCGSITQGAGSNSVFNAGSGGSHVATSDYRLKDDLGPITDPVARVMQLAPKHLRWKPESGSVGEFDNFIAHEVQAVVPDAVVGDKDAVWPDDSPIDPGGVKAQGLDPAKLVPLLTAALQEALTTISDLTARVEALEAA